MSAALAPTGETYQAPAAGPVRTLAIDAAWTDVLSGVPEAEQRSFDLAMIRVPPGSKRVLLLQATDALDGTPASPAQEPAAWVLDPGIHVLAVNRGPADGRFWLAVDPTDAGDGVSPAAVKIMRAG